MPNPVHLIVTPSDEHGLWRTFRVVHRHSAISTPGCARRGAWGRGAMARWRWMRALGIALCGAEPGAAGGAG